MVYDGIVISIIVALFRGGNFKKFTEDLHLKRGWIFPLLLVVQLFVFIFQTRIDWLASASNYLYLSVYVIGLYFLWINRHHHGFNLIFAGVLLNFIVMAANGGRMPVSEEAATILDPHFVQALKEGLYAKHQLLTEHTWFGFLGDIIPLTTPYPRSQVISIGDVVMNVGVYIYIQHLMLPVKKQEDKSTSISAEKAI
ncbi:DUF5317 domain-containing protein [Paenibacillus sediminis]|uniref:Ca2+/Na+ antiporter n=1 Tax=Paenibacillus sediminis TaxID=664909 RepID=A0ABS4H2U1_9BACL|nr:DUF5317 domain-containing protein [Paenibacillus sediminis]MBP1936791.1 Ca2+/Na+ antiporter [Paenibacillus sediminis]